MMPTVKTFRDLLVWQKSMTLVTDVYRVTKEFPNDERFGLTSQIRRSAVSLPSNIAEGHGRNSTKEYIQFLNITMGSMNELETQLEISKNLKYLEDGVFQKLHDNCREIERMLSSLIRKLKQK